MNTKKFYSAALFVALYFSCSASVWSQASASSDTNAYPNKPVRIVVGFAAGGGADILARFFAQRFTEIFNQNFIVENKVGATGNIAAGFVGKAAGDGYTLLMTPNSHVINSILHKNLPYDLVRDFTPISLVAIAPNALTVHPSIGIKTPKEFIALAKTRPGTISYSSPGSGSAQHLAAELFATMAGIKLLHVPYSGGGPSTTAALGGQVQVLTSSLPTALPHIRSGRLLPLGVTSAARSELAPDLQTIAEAAELPGYEATVWYGLFASAGTPPLVAQRLNSAIERLLKMPDVREKMINMGFEPYRGTSEEFGKLIIQDLTRWTKIVELSGAKAD